MNSILPKLIKLFMGWAANPARKQETMFTLGIVQMGQRVYIPSLGRFLQADPVEGGTSNAYVYVQDPINFDDYNGMFGMPKWLSLKNIVRAVAVVIGVGLLVVASLAVAVCVVATLGGCAAPAIAGIAAIASAGVAISAAGIRGTTNNTVTRAAATLAVFAATAQDIMSTSSGSGAKTNIVSEPPEPPQAALNAWEEIKTNNYQSLSTGWRVQTYQNTTKLLPNDTNYTEFYLSPHPNGGVERIVRGDDGSVYYTPDHYDTFVRIE